MRFISLKTAAAVLFGIGLSFSSLCNAVYYAQNVVVQTLESDAVSTLERVSKQNVSSNINELAVLDTSVQYMIPVELEATCKTGLSFPYEKKDVKYLRRKANENLFEEITRSRLVQFYSSVKLGNKDLGWSIFIKPDTGQNAKEYIIYNEEKERFFSYFGTAILRDTMIDETGSAIGYAHSVMPWYVSTDSLSLIESLNGQWGAAPCDMYPDACTDGGTVDRNITLQLVRIRYDTIPPDDPVPVERKSSTPGINVSHTSGGIQISLPIDAHIFNSLKIYSISGELITEIRSFDNKFEWNGKSKSGLRSPSGLYLFRAGSYSGKFYLPSDW